MNIFDKHNELENKLGNYKLPRLTVGNLLNVVDEDIKEIFITNIHTAGREIEEDYYHGTIKFFSVLPDVILDVLANMVVERFEFSHYENTTDENHILVILVDPMKNFGLDDKKEDTSDNEVEKEDNLGEDILNWLFKDKNKNEDIKDDDGEDNEEDHQMEIEETPVKELTPNDLSDKNRPYIGRLIAALRREELLLASETDGYLEEITKGNNPDGFIDGDKVYIRNDIVINLFRTISEPSNALFEELANCHILIKDGEDFVTKIDVIGQWFYIFDIHSLGFIVYNDDPSTRFTGFDEIVKSFSPMKYKPGDYKNELISFVDWVTENKFTEVSERMMAISFDNTIEHVRTNIMNNMMKLGLITSTLVAGRQVNTYQLDRKVIATYHDIIYKGNCMLCNNFRYSAMHRKYVCYDNGMIPVDDPMARTCDEYELDYNRYMNYLQDPERIKKEITRVDYEVEDKDEDNEDSNPDKSNFIGPSPMNYNQANVIDFTREFVLWVVNNSITEITPEDFAKAFDIGVSRAKIILSMFSKQGLLIPTPGGNDKVRKIHIANCRKFIDLLGYKRCNICSKYSGDTKDQNAVCTAKQSVVSGSNEACYNYLPDMNKVTDDVIIPDNEVKGEDDKEESSSDEESHPTKKSRGVRRKDYSEANNFLRRFVAIVISYSLNGTITASETGNLLGVAEWKARTLLETFKLAGVVSDNNSPTKPKIVSLDKCKEYIEVLRNLEEYSTCRFCAFNTGSVMDIKTHCKYLRNTTNATKPSKSCHGYVCSLNRIKRYNEALKNSSQAES